MASAMASAATHHIPSVALPAVPRIRPPRIPKGTPQGNTVLQPAGPVPNGMVWADGKWRHPDSRSAEHKQDVQSRQVEKALKHETHGMNIYAYSHIQTNQVVYSLTKVMQNNKIMPQLLYYGKKTVPEALRRDVWRPYFSIHFPQTPSGAQKGLRVYRELRELSLRRQLEPPESLVTATQQDVDNAKNSMDPIVLREELKKRRKLKLKLPIAGQKLPKRLRAARLMDQKATSVADVAAVLTLHGSRNTPNAIVKKSEQRRKAREELLSNRARIRLSEIRKQEAEIAEKIESRQELAERKNGNLGQVALKRDAARRISAEYEGAIHNGQVTGMEALGRRKQETLVAAGASQALAQLQREMQLEKDLAAESIRREMMPRVDENLASLDQQERSKVDDDMEQDKAAAQKHYDSQRTKLDASLNAARTRLRASIENDTEQLQIATGSERTTLKKRLVKNRKAYRKIQRSRGLALLQLSNERKANLTYLGPYKEVQQKLDEQMKTIEQQYAPRIMALEKEAKNEDHISQSNVEIRWADISAATHAQDWPDTVFHETLQHKSAVKIHGNRVQTHSYIDENEYGVTEQLRPTKIQIASSVHVFGGAQPEEDDKQGWYLSPRVLEAIESAERATREASWESTEVVLARREIVRLRDETRMREPADLASWIEENPETTAALLVNALNSADSSLHIIEEQDTEQASECTEWMNHAKGLTEQLQVEMNAAARSRTPLMAQMPDIAAYAKAFAKQLEFEHNHLNVRAAADRQEEWQRQISERGLLSQAVTEAVNKDSAEQALGTFDAEFPDVARMEERKDELRENSLERTEDIKKAEQDVVNANTAVNNALSALEGKKISNAATEEELNELEAALETSRDNAKFAQETLADLEEQQIEDQATLENVEHDAWLQFKHDGGITSSMPSPRSADSGSSFGLKDMNIEVPSEQLRGSGIWARIKSIFGRRS